MLNLVVLPRCGAAMGVQKPREGTSAGSGNVVLGPAEVELGETISMMTTAEMPGWLDTSAAQAHMVAAARPPNSNHYHRNRTGGVVCQT